MNLYLFNVFLVVMAVLLSQWINYIYICVYAIEYYAALERKEILTHTATWM